MEQQIMFESVECWRSANVSGKAFPLKEMLKSEGLLDVLDSAAQRKINKCYIKNYERIEDGYIVTMSSNVDYLVQTAIYMREICYTIRRKTNQGWREIKAEDAPHAICWVGTAMVCKRKN